METDHFVAGMKGRRTVALSYRLDGHRLFPGFIMLGPRVWPYFDFPIYQTEMTNFRETHGVGCKLVSLCGTYGMFLFLTVASIPVPAPYIAGSYQAHNLCVSNDTIE